MRKDNRYEIAVALHGFWVAYHKAEIAKHQARISKAELKLTQRLARTVSHKGRSQNATTPKDSL